MAANAIYLNVYTRVPGLRAIQVLVRAVDRLPRRLREVLLPLVWSLPCVVGVRVDHVRYRDQRYHYLLSRVGKLTLLSTLIEELNLDAADTQS